MTTPKILAGIPEDAPTYLKVDGFEVEIPADHDPDFLDRFLVTVEVSVLKASPDYKAKETYTSLDGQKIATGRWTRSAPRWVYGSQVVAGSPEIANYEPYQLSLVGFGEEQEAEAV